MRLPLPIDGHLDEIVEHLDEGRRLLVSAEPGAGKTTRLAPALVDAGVLGGSERVVVVEPRRAAARMAATRVAEERESVLGHEIGYAVRFDTKVSAQSRVVFETDGVFLRQILADPALPGVGAVVLDEFHERGLTADLLLAFLCEVQETIRPDLRIVVTSATLETQPLLAFLESKLIEVPGRTYPVEVEYRRDPADGPFRAASLAAHVLGALRSQRDHAAESGSGRASVLVFVPGAAEIRAVMRELESWSAQASMPVMALHGRLPIEEQLVAIRASYARVVVATNVAEASLTVEGVRTVLDSGRARVATHDPDRGLTELRAARISRASAVQRAGRAGRESPGTCIRLYSEADFATRPEHAEPEVRTSELTDAHLCLAQWGVRDPGAFRWLTAPRPRSLEHARETLLALRAIEPDGTLTSTGAELVGLPLSARTGRMLQVARDRGALDAAVRLAAELEHPGGASPGRRSRVEKTRTQLQRAMTRRSGAGSDTAGAAPPTNPASSSTADSESARAFLAGHPERLGRLRPATNERPDADLASGVRAQVDVPLPPGTEYIVAIELVAQRRGRERSLWIPRAAPVEPAWIRQLFGDAITAHTRVHFEATSERVIARRVRSLQRLSLEVDDVPVPLEEGSRVLATAARDHLERLFGHEREFLSLLSRLRWLARLESTSDSGSPSGGPLREWLDDALLSHCASKRSFAELRRKPFAPVVRSLLPHRVRSRLAEWLPETVLLPSGRRARVDYDAGPQPLVAARLQEFFGSGRPPQLGNGQVGLLLHLLAPNGRPVQVTRDLESFWEGVYPKLRKELRRRYPKHAWPEDPHSAPAESRPRRS